MRFGISASEWAGGFSSALEWFGMLVFLLM